MHHEHHKLYSASITGGGLLITETRAIARAMCDGAHESNQSWLHALIDDNILQKKTPASSKRMGNLVRNRLIHFSPAYWQALIDSHADVCTQLVLAATVRESRLLRDYLLEVIKEKISQYDNELSPTNWNHFIESCIARFPAMADWSETTFAKIKNVTHRCLSESGYLHTARSTTITPISLLPEVRAMLLAENASDLIPVLDILS